MEAEDLIDLPASSDSGCGSENNELHNSNCYPSETGSQPIISEVKEDNVERDNPGYSEGDVGNEDSQVIQGIDLDKDLVDDHIMQDSIVLTETISVTEKLNSFSSRVHTENGCLTAQDETPICNHKIDDNSISGVKRARMTIDEQQPSVHVIYNSLTRDSKRKLEELLQQWSEWHAQRGSTSHDSNKVLESGEETYFPALHVGLDKSSAVSFWMDNQTRKQQNREFILMDSDSAPLYDRGYALGLTSADGSSNLEGGLEIIDGSRCFNCGSYNHSLKECPKPRDNAAVNNARKQHKSRRNQNSGSRNPTRYYQNSPGGKYDGLRPGVLGVETRQLLGLGELDPPPWLNRMREMGYPPGYLDPEDEDQPSGITIFADEEIKEEKEDGEILDTDHPEPELEPEPEPKSKPKPKPKPKPEPEPESELEPMPEPQRKMSVEFPGINAPIPENADEGRWAAGSPSFDPYRNRSHRRLNHSVETYSKVHYHEQRWSRDFRDDGPPGCDPGTSPTMSCYPQRYSGYDSSYTSHSPRGNILIPGNPSFGRSLTDRGRRGSLVHGGSPIHGSTNSLPYSSPNRRPSLQNYRSFSSENFADESRNDFTSDYSSHSRDRRDGHYYHSRR